MERTTALILVAEDDPDIQMMVRTVLEKEGYEVATAPDGEQALELARKDPPDLCVLDVMMPKLDGCELTEELRGMDETRETPIILLSARTQWEAVERGRAAGANEYMTKPFVPDDLRRSARSLLTQGATGAADEDASGEADGPPAELLELIAAEDPKPSGSGRLVLVASADVNVVNLVSYRLQLGGFEVSVATDPDEAAELASENPPDLCVLDSSMPGMNGFPVLEIPTPLSVQELYVEVEQRLGANEPQQARAAG